MYRITGDNTYLERNAQIQTKTVEIFRENAFALAEYDAKHRDLMMVDMGGGIDGRPGYITIDQEDADITCDLNDGIPLPDNSVGVLNASHVIEHLRDPVKTMREIHRVLAHGGWAFIEVPSTDGRGAWQDQTLTSVSLNAQISAVGLYKKQDFYPVGDEFFDAWDHAYTNDLRLVGPLGFK